MDEDDHEERIQAGRAARRASDFKLALQIYEEAVELAQRDHWPERELEMRLYAADSARLIGDTTQAEQHLHRAVAIGRQRALTKLLARALGELGTLSVLKGEPTIGAAWYQEALELAERAQDMASIATQKGNLGLLALQRGDFEAARTLLQARLDAVLSLNAPDDAAETLTTLAEVELQCGKLEAAEDALLRVISLQRGRKSVRAVRGLAGAFVLQAKIARQRGHNSEAKRLAKRGLKAAEAAGAVREAAHARLQLGYIAKRRGERERARENLVHAARDLKLSGDSLQALIAEVALAGLAVDEGELNQARESYASASRGFQAQGNPKAALDAQLLSAQLAAKLGNLDEALRGFIAGLESAKELGYSAGVTRFEVNIACSKGLGGRRRLEIAGCLAGARHFEELGLHGDRGLALLAAGESLVDMERFGDADTIFQEAMELFHRLEDPRGVRAAEAWRSHVRLREAPNSEASSRLLELCRSLEEAGDMTLAMPHYLALATQDDAPEKWARELAARSEKIGMWPVEAASKAWLIARAGSAPTDLIQEARRRGYESLAARMSAYVIKS